MPSRTTPSTRTFITPPPTKAVPAKKKSIRPRLPRKLSLPWLLTAALLVACIFLVTQYRHAQAKLHGDTSGTASLEKRLHKLMLLPSDEKPTIATVKDANKLRSQAFFRDAKDGDKVFVYNKAHKAVLYRPSANLIINVQPVGVSSTSR